MARANDRRRVRGSRGFTLLEMGIVLAVAAILAAVVLPDFIEEQRNKMAERAAEGVSVLADASRWHYLDTLRSTGGRWPGEQNPGTCEANFNFGQFKVDLWAGGYVASDVLDPSSKLYENPWGQGIYADLWSGPNCGNKLSCCMLRMSTNVPTAVKGAFKSFLPQPRCTDDPGAPSDACNTTEAFPPPAGFSRCCAYLPKPGIETSLAAGCPAGTFIRWDSATSRLTCQ